MPPAGFQSEKEVEIKRSRFITRVGRTDTESEARTFIAETKARYPDARHHPVAFIVDDGRTAHTSDDGEPSGTAGAPMLASLTQAGLTNITAVVTRYFGGIKLGAGGLTRAYAGCVTAALAGIPRVVREVLTVWRLDIPHADSGRIQEELLRSGARLVSVSYGDTGVCVRFTSPDDPLALIARITQGVLIPTIDGDEIVEILQGS